MILAGRGFGKNFAGSNWLIDKHMTGEMQNTGIVAATASDLRRYCVEGPSGIIAQAPAHFKPKDVPSKSRLEWPNGTYSHYFTAEKPTRLRGPNLDGAWCDELSWWSKMEETWDMLSFALRLGAHPQRIITMTPRPNKLVKKLLEREGRDTVVTRGATYDNMQAICLVYILMNLKRNMKELGLVGRRLAGNCLLMLTARCGIMICWIGFAFLTEPEGLIRIGVGLDPSTTSGEKADEAGIVVAGKDGNGEGHVIADHSLRGNSAAMG